MRKQWYPPVFAWNTTVLATSADAGAAGSAPSPAAAAAAASTPSRNVSIP
ncbi:hypothetical protein AB0383_08905 [Amycolatopsis sp. NPDC051373]